MRNGILAGEAQRMNPASGLRIFLDSPHPAAPPSGRVARRCGRASAPRLEQTFGALPAHRSVFWHRDSRSAAGAPVKRLSAVSCGTAGDHDHHGPMTSWPNTVPSACHVFKSIVSLAKCTDPSIIKTCTPPGWRLRADISTLRVLKSL